MARDIRFIVSSSEEMKTKVGDWSDKWFKLRGRHPFFIMHSGSREIDHMLVGMLREFREVATGFPVDVIIDSPGGLMDASFKAALFFQSYCDYAAIVPRYAKSGATLFSLGASEIVLGRWAELGPLDPQIESFQTERKYFIEQESALEGFHAARYAQREVLEHFEAFLNFLITKIGISPMSAVQEAVTLTEATIGKVYSNVSPFELGNSGRLLEVMEKYCLRIMQKPYGQLSQKRRDSISHKLVWEYPEHDFFIDYEEAKKIGLNVSEATTEIQALLDELTQYYGKVSCTGIALPTPEGNGTNNHVESVESKEKITQPQAGGDNGSRRKKAN